MNSRRIPPTRRQRIVVGLSFLALLGSLGLGGLFLLRRVESYSLPPSEKLRFDKLRPSSAVEVRDASGRVVDYWYEGRLRLYRPLSQIDPKLAEFVVFLEDAKFYWHEGFDMEEIRNSVEENLEKGKIKRGASTITQQLAKNLFLDKERSFTRKLFEMPWTYRLEKDLSKRQILELYLNVIEWGPGVYGAEAAARHFFDKPAARLEIGEAMYLALIIPNPKRFDLFAYPKRAEFLEKKKSWLVERLVGEKKISPGEKPAYLAASFRLVPPDAPGRHYAVSHDASYFGNRGKRSAEYKKAEARLRPRSRGLPVVTLDTPTEPPPTPDAETAGSEQGD